MIKNDKDYKKRRHEASKPVELLTDTDFTQGRRRGVLAIEEEVMIFREMITAARRRSKQIARTAHFSVLERPDGTISGTFTFNPNSKKIKGQLSAEFWQAITLALTTKGKTDEN